MDARCISEVALINDQEATLSKFAAPFEDIFMTRYTGGLNSAERPGP